MGLIDSIAKDPRNDLIDIALDNFKKGGQWDEWLDDLFKDRENLHLLLARAINQETCYLAQPKKIRELKRALAFSNRANASKRRHLKRMMLVLQAYMSGVQHSRGKQWVVIQLMQMGIGFKIDQWRRSLRLNPNAKTT